MVMTGREEAVLLDDGWTVVTADGSWAAHFEHTVAVTSDGPWVLTAEDGGTSGFARYAETRQDGASAAGRGITEGGLGDTKKRDAASVPPT
jgi:hypothetical protein